MNCEVIKIGMDCPFMSKKGCGYNGGKCYPIIEKCKGCERVKVFPSGEFCIACPDPESKWASRDCNLATHIVKAKSQEPVKEMNPLKASKRKAAGKH